MIKKKEKCDWKDLIYIGDNPEKDFINLNIKGATTIRVLTGAHSKKKAKKGYDAKYKIKNIGDLEPLINKFMDIFRTYNLWKPISELSIATN